jgi:hypothetical protein
MKDQRLVEITLLRGTLPIMIEIVRLSPNEATRFKIIRLRCLKENPEAFGTTFETASSSDENNWISQVEKTNTFIATLAGVDVGVVRTVKDEQDSESALVI